jgi:hypothetical protein
MTQFLPAQLASVAKPKSIACADVKGAVDLPETTITLSEELPAGANPNPVGTIPVPICRVVGVTAPAIQFEVWMPSQDWNGSSSLSATGEPLVSSATLR